MLMPYNTDHRQSCQKWDEIEYPINAVVDSTAQPSKVAPVRNSRIRRSHKRLEIIEPPAMIILRIPAHVIQAFDVLDIDGRVNVNSFGE